MQHSPQTPDDETVQRVLVVVTRSGGIAGMRRQWRAEPVGAEASEWRALIEQCPWDAHAGRDPSALRGADRFEWIIRARDDVADREAELADHELEGAWRVLVDAVRGWSGPRRPKLSARRDGSS